MNAGEAHQPTEHQFEEIVPRAVAGRRLRVEDLKDVRLEITASLGTCTMLVRDIVELKRGAIIRLTKLAGETTDIFMNGLPLARGEIVVIGDALHVRVSELVGQEERGEETTLTGTGNE
jgi:flagellar motor switch protein FliN/FliY